MKEVKGDAFKTWEWYGSNDEWLLCITTNGTVKKDGDAVMGAGIAKQAKEIFPWIPAQLGQFLSKYGNRMCYLGCNLITFPVKHNWYEKADIQLIKASCKELMDSLDDLKEDRGCEVKALLVRPGCGNGKLNWETEVKPVISKLLDDRVVVIHNE